MKKILLFQVLFTFIFFSCSKDDFEEPNMTDRKLESFTAYMVPFKYGQPSEINKFIWSEEKYYEDGMLKKKSYRANSNFDESNNTLWAEYYKYENGFLKEMNSKKYDILQDKRHVYKYDNEKHIGTDVYGENGLVEKYEFKYQNNEKQPKQMLYWWYYFDSTPTTHTYTYDNNGNMIKDSINYSNVPYGILFWKYDSHNNMIEESYYSSETKKTVVQAIRNYKYDSTGKIQEYVFSSWYTIYFQKYMYQYSDNGTVSQIDAYESTNGQDGIFEQKGVIKYEYNYY